MKTLTDTKGYGNKPRLVGKQYRTGTLGTVVRQMGNTTETLAVEITADDLTAANAVQKLELPPLPAQAEVLKIMVDLKTVFDSSTDAGIDSIILKIGNADDGAQYENLIQLHADGNPIAVGRHTCVPASGSAFDVSSTGEVHLTLTTDGGGTPLASEIDSGKLVVAVLYAIMPT